MADLGPDLRAAMDDAALAGVGWIRVRKTSDGFVVERVAPGVVVVLNALTHRLGTVGEAVLAIPCSACGAKYAEACMTPAGRPTSPHTARMRPILQAYDAGQRLGKVALLRQIVDDHETPAEQLLARHGVTR